MTTRKPTIWPMTTLASSGPLQGVRVLDLTTVLMGPSATQLLGDLGADVMKIEAEEGDSMRWVGPWRHAGMGPIFLWANRNKRSVQVDLKSADGQNIIQGLAAEADVLVSNLRPQSLSRLGLSYDDLRARNPQLIYCAAVGYGSGGPNAGQPVYDDLMQAASGLSGLFARMDGVPRYAPINLCDRIVGLYVVNAITTALFHRARSGEGQEIEVPMFETMVQLILSDHVGGEAFVPAEGGMGYKRLLSANRGPYATADGYLALVVYTNRHWEAFGRLIGCPDLLSDARFSDQDARTTYAAEIGSFLAEQLRTRPTSDWLSLLRDADIPVCKVNSIEDLFRDPHLEAVDFFTEADHPTEGRVKVACHPVRYARTPASIRRLAPNLGEHNGELWVALNQDDDGLMPKA
jgi:crotonobetainyl-CoA:carnitine CoA-transferase CaiB-like acyl-CoA transferase